MNYKITTIHIEDKDRKRLNNRYCDVCSDHLVRGKTEGLENWINRRFCCKKCMLEDRKENGLVYSNFEYKCRKLVSTENNVWGITVPHWFVKKYNLKSLYYYFECFIGEFLVYSKKKKGLKMMKLRTTGMKGYYHIGIPIDIVRKYKLQGKMFKFRDKGEKYILYAEINKKEVKNNGNNRTY